MSVKQVQAIVNGQTYTLTFNSNTGKYEATVTAPNKSSYSQSGHYYGITIKATDDAGNVTTKDATSSPVTVMINGTPVTVGSNGAFSTTVTLSAGSNTITIVAKDSAGKTTTITRTVKYDPNPPKITAASVTPNPVDAGKTYVISVTVTDE